MLTGTSDKHALQYLKSNPKIRLLNTSWHDLASQIKNILVKTMEFKFLIL